ncbi:MAG TPA: nucleotidyltransferase family protein [Syntrophales bacterium]|nr:nucleotidyltransferase family protein [Syntrophales bacterium]
MTFSHGKEIKTIILAGGMGTRLRGMVNVPKSMALIGGKPFLEYLILQLKKWQMKDIVLSVGYKRDTIKSYFGNGSEFDVVISYSEEDQPLGTGGALKKAMATTDNDSFVVMNGDSVFDINFRDLINYHTGTPGIATMALSIVKDRSRYGSVEISADGEITGFKKEGVKNPGLINSGIYVVNRDVISYIPDGQISLEGLVLPLIQKDSLLYGKIFDAFFIDIGTPEAYQWANEHPEYLTDVYSSRGQNCDISDKGKQEKP